MKPTKEQVEAYRAMVKDQPRTMETMIHDHLEQNCLKFKGNEDKMERCLEYLNGCAREILDGKSGDVADDVCFKICRDYFNDEVWKAEDEEKAEQERLAAERKARSDKRSKAAQGKKYPKTVTASVADAKADDDEEDDDEQEKRYDLAAKPKACDGQLDMFALMGV